MSRSTKLIVVASNLAALWLIAALVSRAFPSLFGPSLAAFAAGVIAAFFLREVAVSVALSLMYVVPAICFARFNTFVYWYYVIWLAGLTGAMLPKLLVSRWAFPGRLAAPLVLWALVIALSWPIVALREVDFVPSLITLAGMATSHLPQVPALNVVWIASVSAIVMTGLLLFDWSFLTYGVSRTKQFETRVIWPMAGAAAFSGAIAVYQSTVDLSFLNHTVFESYGRAVGTTRDANAFGAIEAMWVPFAGAMVLAARERRNNLGMWVWAIVLAVIGIAVWGSGSRTALLAALIGLSVVVVHARRLFTRRKVAIGLVAGAVACVAIAWLVPSTTWARVRSVVPSFSKADLQSAAYQLWSRDMYGTAANQMIAEHPFVGVGVGGFIFQHGEVLFRLDRTERPPDNAQNWYRQQLAELGIIGSIPWMAWTAMFVWLLVRVRDREGAHLMAAAPKGAVAGVAAASLLGIPTQDTAASITFAVMMCWCVMLKDIPEAVADSRVERRAKLERTAALAVLACFLGGTVYAARTDLRPPLRSLRTGFPYRYGFTADDTNPALRWTGAKAVEIFPAEKRWFKLVLGDVAPDAAVRPVEVRVWMNGLQILRVNRQSNFPLERWIRMPAYGTPVMIEFAVNRTWQPAAPDGVHDASERGVAIREWSFSDEDPPKGSVTTESLDRPGEQ